MLILLGYIQFGGFIMNAIVVDHETGKVITYNQQALIDAADNARIQAIGYFDTSILAGTKSANTIEQYKMHFTAYCRFAGTFTNAKKPTTLAQWRQSLYNDGYSLNDGTIKQYSVAAINQRLAAIRGVMQEAAQQGYISHEVAEQFKHVKGLKQVANKERRKSHARTAISKADMQRIVDAPDANTAAGMMHRALLLTLATCGMRISEAVSLKIADLQFETNEDGSGWVALVLGKNMEKPEPRPLGKQAKAAIDAWLEVRAGLNVTSEYIFTGFGGRGSRNPSDKAINRVSAWEAVQRYAKALDLDHIKPHDFRRFVGTQLAKKDIRLAQKQLGHKRLETTASHYVLDAVALGVTDNLI
jgi:integrase